VDISHKCIINPLNAELNPICHLLSLLEDRHILHISRIRVKEVEFCMFCDEKFILHTEHRYIKNSLRCTLSATDKLRYNFWGSSTTMQNVFLIQNE